MLKFVRISTILNIQDLFNFFKVFCTNLLCTVRYSHVLTIIRLPVKFHIGLSVSGHWDRRRKSGLLFIPKTVQKCELHKKMSLFIIIELILLCKIIKFKVECKLRGISEKPFRAQKFAWVLFSIRYHQQTETIVKNAIRVQKHFLALHVRS